MEISKKIVIFIQNGIGGSERVQLQIAEMLISAGWKVCICRVVKPCEQEENARIEEFYPKNVYKQTIRLTSHFSFLGELYNVINKEQPSVVFSSVMNISRYLLLLKPIFRKIKFVVRCNNYLTTISKKKKIITLLVYRFADKIISQTEEMEEELYKGGIRKEKIKTLHNPLNVENIIERSMEKITEGIEESPRFVSVGRFAYQKGYDLLLRAFNKVKKTLPKSKLIIVGRTSYGNSVEFNKIKKYIEDKGLEKHVLIVGEKKNPYPYMRQADVYVMSSRWEGLPNTLIESQLLGIPAAAYKCIPIIERVVKDGITGYTAEKEDIDSLALAMIKASQLGRIKMIYEPSKTEEFVNLFNGL